MDNSLASGSELLSLGVNLLIVVGLIIGAGWLYARLRSPLAGAGRQIKVIANCSVGRHEKMLLVDVAGQHLLVGTTPAGIRTLFVFDGEIEVDAVEAPTGGFADRLRAAITKAGT